MFPPLPLKGNSPRIGVSGLALSFPETRNRGIGRYARGLIKALATAAPDVQYVLYVPSAHRAPDLAFPPNVFPASHHGSLPARLAGNPDQLDTFLDPCPALGCPEVSGIPRRVAVVYDAIPCREPERYLSESNHRTIYYASMDRLRTFDALLAISAWAATDCAEHFQFDPNRLHVIGAGIEPVFAPSDDSELLSSLGIVHPFVLHVGGGDDRKGGKELIQAFAQLPEAIRAHHQLVYAYDAETIHRKVLTDEAERLGVGNRLLFTGYVPDETLRALYTFCAAFSLPSRNEGFGLPAAEAMACGAPVILRESSSLPEVGGKAAYYHGEDTAELAAALEAVLTNETLAAAMRKAGLDRAKAFTWEAVADRALPHLLGGVPNGARFSSAQEAEAAQPRRRPRIAIVSPFPPLLSGVADYAERLAKAIEPRADVHRVRDEQTADGRPLDFRYDDGVFYHIGNHEMHRWIFDYAVTHPGITTIHDIELSNLDRPAALDRLCVASKAIIVHSQTAFDRLPPAGQQKGRIVPFGVSENVIDPTRRIQIRKAHGLGADNFVVTVAGIVSCNKMVLEAIAGFAFGLKHGAFELKGSTVPQNACLVVLGDPLKSHFTNVFVYTFQEWIKDRIFFVDNLRGDDFADFCAASDVGVVLRRPPTNGETSAACLDFMRAGVPCVVSNVGSFAEYPDDAVCKIDPEHTGGRPCGIEGVAHALGRLANDRAFARQVGLAGLAHVRAHNSWDCVTAAYLELAGAKPRVPLGINQKAAQAEGAGAAKG